MDTSAYGESAYLSPELAEQSTSQKVYICGKAKIVQGKFGDKLEIPIELDGKQKTWTLTRDHVKTLQQFGKGKVNPSDDSHWVGQWVRLQVISNNGKKQIVAIPVITEVQNV